MFHYTLDSLVAGALYTGLLTIAAITDFRAHRIPNRVVAPLAAAGVAFAIMSRSVDDGVRFAVAGAAVGLFVWLPFYLLRWIGAGDVKLMTAVGAWLGMDGVLRASLAGAVAAGALALALLVWRRTSKDAAATMILLVNTVRKKPASLLVPRQSVVAASDRVMPYGVALVVGALAAGWFNSSF
jgi:prepilin peptidase CpaA